MSPQPQPLSPKAQAIFDKLQPFFPPDSFGNVCWEREGVVIQNAKRLDLRDKDVRRSLENHYQQIVGSTVSLQAKAFRKKKGSLAEFAFERYPTMIIDWLEILLILDELDFQIETLDLVES